MKSILLILSIAYVWFGLQEMLQSIREMYRLHQNEPILNRLFNVAKGIVTQAMTCGKCFTFWVGLGLSFNLVIAAAASAAFDLYDRIKNRLF